MRLLVQVGENLTILVLSVVEETQDDRDGGEGSEEPESKVLLAVVVDMADGTAVDGFVSLDGVTVQQGLALLDTTDVGVGGGGTVAGHGGSVDKM